MCYHKLTTVDKLNKKELLLLKLIVSGFTDDELLKRFGLNPSMIMNTIFEIKRKIGLSEWSAIIRKAFVNNLISTYDFTEECVRELASNYAIVIYSSYSHLKSKQYRWKRVSGLIMEFWENCNLELYFISSAKFSKNNALNMKITLKEKKLIEYVYRGIHSEELLAKKLKVSINDISNMRLNILKKLSSNSWYNAIRKAFQMNLLDKDLYCDINLLQEIETCVQNILAIDPANYKSDIDIKLKIYLELIDLYNKYEYSYLLRENFKKFLKKEALVN